MLELSQFYGKGLLSADTLAVHQNISDKYIRLLLGPLQTAGLIRAVRGVGGGYELSKPPGEITALEVISALEGKAEPAPCTGKKFRCDRASYCSAKNVWRKLASTVENVLAGFYLSDLVGEVQGKREEGIIYHI